MNAATRATAMRALSKLARIDLRTAVQFRRHNPILDSEIDIEEELINLKESLDSYHTAGETIRNYPQMHMHLSRERRAIMRHCLGLAARMVEGRKLPRDYTRHDVDDALRRLIQLAVSETRRAGKHLDEEVLAALRPYLSVRQRLVLHDFGVDLVVQASQWNRAIQMAAKLPHLWAR